MVHVIDGLGAGGAERSLVELLPVARAAGWASTVVCLYRREQGVQSGALDRGEDVRFLGARSLPGRVRALRRVLDDVDPDLVHSTLFDATMVSRLACRGRQAPLLTSLVNTPYAEARLRDPNVHVVSLRALRGLDQATSRWTDRFHAITGAVADAATRDLGVHCGRISVIPRGRDPERLGKPSPARRTAARASLGIGCSTPIVVTIGRHEYQKGQIHLLRAVRRLLDDHPEAVILLAGRDGAASAELRRVHAELGLGDRVRFLGHRDDVPELLAAADVFAFPSVYEGLGGALIEAMALGLPVVASDIPAVREVVENGLTADLVAPGDPVALGEAVARLLSDRDRLKAYGDQGRRRFEREYTLAESTSRMLALYDEVRKAPPTVADDHGGRRRPRERGRDMSAAGRPALERALARSPAQRMARRWSARRLTVLAYHGVEDAERFAAQLDCLVDDAHPISLDTAVSALVGGTELPSNAVLLTFDDGDRSVLERGLPLLRACGVPAVVFAVGSLLDTDEPFWWTEVEALVGAGGQVDGVDGDGRDVVSYLKRRPDDERRAAIAGLRIGREQVRQPQLTTDDLRQLEAGGVVVGNHTLTHPILARCRTARIEIELEQAHGRLTDALGHAPTAFAYPNGDHDPRVPPVLRRLGYDVAFLFDHRLAAVPAADPFRVSRLRISSDAPVARLKTMLSGLNPALHQLRHKA